MKYCYDYPRPALAADCLIFGKMDNTWQLLLIERLNDPYKAYWALPGGFIEMDETAEEGAARELFEETGLKNITLEQLHTFSRVDRDPRGRTVTVAVTGFVEIQSVQPKAGDDAARVQWFPLSEVPALAFDHDEMLSISLSKLKL
jgi:8-oxo-dGTP diphosphatase